MEEVKIQKYILIDKDYITQHSTLMFDIYIKAGPKVALFLSKETLINDTHKITIRDFPALYIPKEQRSDYDDYVALHIRTIAKDHTIPFEMKSTAVYQKAERVMEDLFSNPEALGNMEKSKDLVNDLVATILDDDFTVDSLMAIAAHDYYTHTHSINVSIYALSLGNYLKLPKEDLETLGQAALLHDLGKSKVNTDIINKNGKLDTSEFAEMMNHPAWGHEIAIKMGVTDKRILAGIRFHHEKLDGTGYPDKLKDKQIPLFSRIIAICDIFDALTTRRSYKDPMTTFNAIKLIKNQMQGHVDMSMVDNLIHMCHVVKPKDD